MSRHTQPAFGERLQDVVKLDSNRRSHPATIDTEKELFIPSIQACQSNHQQAVAYLINSTSHVYKEVIELGHDLMDRLLAVLSVPGD